MVHGLDGERNQDNYFYLFEKYKHEKVDLQVKDDRRDQGTFSKEYQKKEIK